MTVWPKFSNKRPVLCALCEKIRDHGQKVNDLCNNDQIVYDSFVGLFPFFSFLFLKSFRILSAAAAAYAQSLTLFPWKFWYFHKRREKTMKILIIGQIHLVQKWGTPRRLTMVLIHRKINLHLNVLRLVRMWMRLQSYKNCCCCMVWCGGCCV